MSDLNAAPSSTEPAADVAPMSPAELAALPDWVKNGQPPAPEAGTAAMGETAAAPAAAAPSDISATTSAAAAESGATPGAGEPGNAGASAALLPLSTSDAGSSDAPLSPAAPAAGSDGGDAPTIHSDLAGAIGDAVLTGTGYYRIGGEDAEPAIQAGADSINIGAHLSRLDAMLAELERKIAAGIHTFAHEITAAREHLAKPL